MSAILILKFWIGYDDIFCNCDNECILLMISLHKIGTGTWHTSLNQKSFTLDNLLDYVIKVV